MRAVDAGFAQAAEAARRGGDELRALLAEAALARAPRCSATAPRALARWGARLNAASAPRAIPALAAWIHDFLALTANQAADFSAAASHFMRCHEAALQSGQLRAAITRRRQHRRKLHHAGRPPDRARMEPGRARTGAPCRLAAQRGRLPDAKRRHAAPPRPARRRAATCSTQALATLKPLENARSYAIALQYLGDLSLDRGDFDAALDAFRRIEARADALGQADFHSAARRGQAHALSHLGRAAGSARSGHQRGRAWRPNRRTRTTTSPRCA